MKKNEKYNLNLENDVFNLVKKHKKIIYLQSDTNFSELTKKQK